MLRTPRSHRTRPPLILSWPNPFPPFVRIELCAKTMRLLVRSGISGLASLRTSLATIQSLHTPYFRTHGERRRMTNGTGKDKPGWEKIQFCGAARCYVYLSDVSSFAFSIDEEYGQRPWESAFRKKQMVYSRLDAPRASCPEFSRVLLARTQETW